MYKKGCVYDDMKLTTHLHLVQRLRKSGPTLLLPPYACFEWRGKILPFSANVSVSNMAVANIA